MSRPKTMFTLSSLDGSVTLQVPNPDTPSAANTITTLVNSARNANATVTAQKIGRDQEKTEMSWNYLEKEEWEALLRFWDEHFFFNFSYYSRTRGIKITRKFYIGDRTDRPFAVTANGVPTAYVDCKANVVDVGEGS